MAKKDMDFGSEEAEVKVSEMAPTAKIGVLVRYRTGRKQEAIDAVFEKFGTAEGLVVKVGCCGQSRRYPSPLQFPGDNSYVHGVPSAFFVKYEVLD